jgi:leader peptidase (prepilin peptidase) / N-methyltransferase
MQDWTIWLLAGITGAIVGSFLNVCVHRWPEGGSVVRPRSSCPRCGQGIEWRDNVPLLGYVLLRGRCRGCRGPISPVYPLVEAVTALIWIGGFARYGLSWNALAVSLFFTILLGIAITDARTYIIPDEFSLGGLAIGLALAFTPAGITVLQSFAGAALGFTLLYATAVVGEWWLGKPAMGGGDIKMMAMVGAFLGPVGALLTIFLGALVGSIIFLPVSLRSGKLVPFGIFLAVGAAVTEVWGGAIIGWYRVSMLGL